MYGDTCVGSSHLVCSFFFLFFSEDQSGSDRDCFRFDVLVRDIRGREERYAQQSPDWFMHHTQREYCATISTAKILLS